MSIAQQQVVTLLENVLFESPALAEANAAAWASNPAASSVASLAAAMAASPEENIAAQIVGDYLASLGRPPTAAEIQFYVSFAEKGLTPAQIAAGQVPQSTWNSISSFFTESPEFAGRAGLDYSLGGTAALLEVVPWLYQSVLGRAPSVAEISFYDNQITAGAGLNTLFHEFTASPEFHTDTASQIAAALAAYGTAVADGQDPTTIAATVSLGPPAPPPPPKPVPGPVPAPPFGSFTAGTDAINDHLAAAHTYTATLGAAATLTAGDSLSGNSFAALTITDTAGSATDVMPGSVTLTAVPTITLTTAGNAGVSTGSPFDVSGATGLTHFTLDSLGTLGDFLNTGSATLVSVTAHGAGDTLALASNSLGTLILAGTLAGVTLTDPSGPTSLTVDISGLTLSGGFTDASNHITSLGIAGSGSASSISAINDSALTSLSVSGNVALGSATSPLTLPSSLTNLDLSGDSAAVHLDTQGANATLQLGSGTAYIGGTGSVTVNNFSSLVLTNDSFSSLTIWTGAGSLTVQDATGPTSLSINVDFASLSITDASNHITSLSIVEPTSGVAVVSSITDSALTSLTVSGNVLLPMSLPTQLTNLDLSSDNLSSTLTLQLSNATVLLGDSSTNYIELIGFSDTVRVGNGDSNVINDLVGSNIITVGTGNNTINPAGGDIIVVGSDSHYGSTPTTANANQTILNAIPGILISIANSPGLGTLTQETLSGVTSAAGAIAALENDVATHGGTGVWAAYNGETYLVASQTGTLGATDTTVVGIAGTHTLSLFVSGSGNYAEITS